MIENAFFFYHRCDDNMFETCLRTLRNYSECRIIVATDNVPTQMQREFTFKYDVNWIVLNSTKVLNRRAACKIEVLEEFTERLSNENVVFVSDVDMYFLANPFTAFTEYKFDIGLTTRGYDYYFPINGGVVCLVCNGKAKEWLKWHVFELYDMTWPPYVKYNKRHRQRFGLDWAAGQDFLIACWEQRDWIEETKGIVIKDIGSKYNYCPPSDKWKQKAFEAIRKAYREKSVIALHLKSTLKDMLYEGLFEDAVTKYPRCSNDWYSVGKNT